MVIRIMNCEKKTRRIPDRLVQLGKSYPDKTMGDFDRDAEISHAWRRSWTPRA
ncbi:MAG: hypothetical protein JSV89_20730 [Spirochaetaceae bacterium]|nr:MAG: hypothetical protein JSV89_20730 [Spirochaetaceae bacterium]